MLFHVQKRIKPCKSWNIICLRNASRRTCANCPVPHQGGSNNLRLPHQEVQFVVQCSAPGDESHDNHRLSETLIQSDSFSLGES